jgi:hypothetical protein
MRGFLQVAWLEQLYHVAKVLDAFGFHGAAAKVWAYMATISKEMVP